MTEVEPEEWPAEIVPVAALLQEIRRVWDHPAVGPPETRSAEVIGELIVLWTSALDGIRSWWRTSRRHSRPLTTSSAPVVMHESLSAEFTDVTERATRVLSDVLAVVRREAPAENLESQVFPLGALLTEYIDVGRRVAAMGLTRADGSQADGEAQSLIDRVRRLMELEDVRRIAARARQAAEGAEAAADSSRRAAGEVAVLNLAEHFERFRRAEQRISEVLRAGAILIIGAAVLILMRLPHDDISVAQVLQRALIALPVFGLAAYLAAEAGRHRRAGLWAATLEVQLRTVDAFCEPLGETEAVEVRQLLARRAFGELPGAAAGKDGEPDAVMPVGLQALIERLLVELRSRPEAK